MSLTLGTYNAGCAAYCAGAAYDIDYNGYICIDGPTYYNWKTAAAGLEPYTQPLP